MGRPSGRLAKIVEEAGVAQALLAAQLVGDVLAVQHHLGQTAGDVEHAEGDDERCEVEPGYQQPVDPADQHPDGQRDITTITQTLREHDRSAERQVSRRGTGCRPRRRSARPIEPTDRSMPPFRMTSSMPRATIALKATCLVIVVRLPARQVVVAEHGEDRR